MNTHYDPENLQSTRESFRDIDVSGLNNLNTGPRIAEATKLAAEKMVNNYKLTPATLYNKIDPTWIPKSFLLQASMKIAQTIMKPNGRLIISWPPRHGKSRLATIATPVWILENFPMLNIILATYGADLSTDFGREVRDIMERNKHLLSERIRSDVKSVGRFMTEKGGGMLSVGLGGAITGKGANVFLIDDYIKTMAEALSKAKRDADWEWFTGTAYHRLEPDASMIIIATRWHKDDLIGRIVRDFGVKSEENPDGWDYIKFNALALDNDPLGRIPGEPLFPERYDVKALEDRRTVLGSLFFNAIFQQDPEDEDSKVTDRDWIEVVDYLPDPKTLKWARIWDFGGGKGKENDPTVGTLLGVDKLTGFGYIADIKRKQMSPQVIENTVKACAESDGSACQIIIEKEPGASGIQLLDHYTHTVLPDYKVHPSAATSSKLVRAQPWLAAAEAGKIKILKRAWNNDFLKEFDDFPDGAHDDQVDTVAMGYNKLLGKKAYSATWGRNIINVNDPEYNIEDSQEVSGAVWGKR